MGELKMLPQEAFLTTKEVANIKGITERAVRKQIINGQLIAIQEVSQLGGGKNGIFYKVPLSSLNDREQIKYWKKAAFQAPEDVRQTRPIDEYSEEDRRVIQQWVDAIQDWQMYRSRYRGQKNVADEVWVEANTGKYNLLTLSVDNLYRKWKAFKENDYDGLVDKRGRWAKGKNTIPEIVWELFKYYYLDEAQHPVYKCVQYVTWYLEKEMPELLPDLPSYHAFYRAIKTIPFAVVKLFREGEKAFEDEAAPYITRMYDGLEVNEVWVADAHTFDVMTIRDGTEKVHRLTIVAFAEARSKMRHFEARHS